MRRGNDFTQTMIEQAFAESIVEEPDGEQNLEEIDSRVLAGVRFLDYRIPGWANLIDLDKFDITHSDTCVLGQLYNGDYYYGVHELLVDSQRDTERFGFEGGLVSDGDDWESLEGSWRKVIADRQKGGDAAT